MTPNSQAYSMSSSLAMMMKFWLAKARTMARMTAKVMVVVAMMMHGRLALYTLP